MRLGSLRIQKSLKDKPKVVQPGLLVIVCVILMVAPKGLTGQEIAGETERVSKTETAEESSLVRVKGLGEPAPWMPISQNLLQSPHGLLTPSSTSPLQSLSLPSHFSAVGSTSPSQPDQNPPEQVR